jgi:hypothetical protein
MSTSGSAAGWREAVVGTLLSEFDPGAAVGFYPPTPSGASAAASSDDDAASAGRRRGVRRGASRSTAGSPVDGGGWARMTALRRAGEAPAAPRTSERGARGTSVVPARPASPLVMYPLRPELRPGSGGPGPGIAAGAWRPRPRAGSHDDSSGGGDHAGGGAPPPSPPLPGPSPAPLSIAPGAAPRLSAELLRRVAAPACAAAPGAPPALYAAAAAERARFWAAAGAPAAAAAAALGAQLESFAASVTEAARAARPARLDAVTRVTRALQDLWPRARTRVFGSEATGLALPSSDVDLVVALPPVRQLPPIKEAGILEGRNDINESFVKKAARQLARQEWIAADSLKCIENTAVPIISLLVRAPAGRAPAAAAAPNAAAAAVPEPAAAAVRVDLSFDAPGHAGLTTVELVRELVARYPAVRHATAAFARAALCMPCHADARACPCPARRGSWRHSRSRRSSFSRSAACTTPTRAG